MRVKTLVFVCLVFLTALASHARVASGAGSLRFRKLPAITPDIEALPRLVAGAKPAIVKRINDILARRDAWVRSAARDCHGDWLRQVSLTMQGPLYASVVASGGHFCDGGNPDNDLEALVFDLNTGRPPDWPKLLPGLALRTNFEDEGNVETWDTVSSDKLANLYRDAAKRDGGQPECIDVLKETNLRFFLWPDAKQDGLVMHPLNLPRAMRACETDFAIPLETLRSLGANAELLKAIDAAHREGGGG